MMSVALISLAMNASWKGVRRLKNSLSVLQMSGMEGDEKNCGRISSFLEDHYLHT